MDIRRIWKHTETGAISLPLQDASAIVEQRPIAAELVYGEGAQQSAFFGGQQIDGPDDRCEDAAALGVKSPPKSGAPRWPVLLPANTFPLIPL
jgi:hypothetical protein